jgi:hypothetical protein
MAKMVSFERDLDPPADVSTPSSPTILIVGAGVAGRTLCTLLNALRLPEDPQTNAYQVRAFERKISFADGPPYCHLHSGGLLYTSRISSAEAERLLQQSIDFVQMYPTCISYRPTVIAIRKNHTGCTVSKLIRRCSDLQLAYARLVAEDPTKQVLGSPSSYFKAYSLKKVLEICFDSVGRLRDAVRTPCCMNDWLLNWMQQGIRLDQLKFPIVLVQELGISHFREIAAFDSTYEEHLKRSGKNKPSWRVSLGAEVLSVKQVNKSGALLWKVDYRSKAGVMKSCWGHYLVNAAGASSGVIDDQLGVPSPRSLEFKASYFVRLRSPSLDFPIPEAAFLGVRGTDDTEEDLPPYVQAAYYGKGLYQLHVLTDQITLFPFGLTASDPSASQPKEPPAVKQFYENFQETCVSRAQAAIQATAALQANFEAGGHLVGRPLLGVQCILGLDIEKRGSSALEYGAAASMPIVKGISAVTASREVLGFINKYFAKQGLTADLLRLDGEKQTALATQLAQLVELPPEVVDLVPQTGPSLNPRL